MVWYNSSFKRLTLAPFLARFFFAILWWFSNDEASDSSYQKPFFNLLVWLARTSHQLGIADDDRKDALDYNTGGGLQELFFFDLANSICKI